MPGRMNLKIYIVQLNSIQWDNQGNSNKNLNQFTMLYKWQFPAVINSVRLEDESRVERYSVYYFHNIL